MDQTFSIVSNLDPSPTHPKKTSNNFFAKILHRRFSTSKHDKPSNDQSSHYCESPTSQPTTPLPQKLFFKPGVIEEMEEEMEYPSRAESPLMYRTSNYVISPSMSGLNRTSTCNSTLSQMAGRQDSRHAQCSNYASQISKITRVSNIVHQQFSCFLYSLHPWPYTNPSWSRRYAILSTPKVLLIFVKTYA
ncbi:hypothetical protein AMK59_2567 [Oryctes borbonicus]|uniref:Uncharacterized protein n=1 Tax=Oryctes borbonicus TaxID=1629725 RepID=A0A0T6BBA2_9SCAR|nr:hypothetical protein AMK59_2567 [Oryctes borbonicus]